MNRPILIFTIGYIIGIIWGLYLQISIALLYIILLGIYLIINFRYRKRKFKLFSIKRYFRYIKLIFKINVILIIIIASFISNSILIYQNNKYKNLYKDIKNINFIGIVISNKQEKEYYNRYKVKICEGKFKNTNLYINIKQELDYGDKIQIKGEFQEPKTARNYKGFNYKEYLKTKKIYGIVKPKTIKIIQKNQANKLMQISNKVFLNIKDNIEKTYSPNISGIVLGIMLGKTDEIDENVKQDFSMSNISHVLAVSGMHISYVIILITILTNKVLGNRMSKIISCCVLIFYMFITGFSPSVVRASITGIISCMAVILCRKNNTLNSISIAALITLIDNPFSIRGISFLLTYGGTLGIIYFNSIIEKALKNIKIRDRRWKYTFLKLQRRCKKLIQIISLSISAQIFIAPIIIIYFNTIGINFLITNLLLSCIIGIIVMCGFIQILISFLSLNIGTYIAKLIQIPIYGLILISKINFGNFKIVTPSLYEIIFYYVIIFILRNLYKIFNYRHISLTEQRVKNTIYLIKYKLKPYAVKLKAIVTIVVIVIILINKIPHELKIHFIDVGQGDSTLIISPNDKKILIDGGGSSTYDVGEYTLLPYLLDRKIKDLDYIIVSHFDQDHVRLYPTNYKEFRSRTNNHWKTV